jgi:hypothetical protein
MSERYAIFCADPLNPRSAEPDFASEVAAAREAGFKTAVLDHDSLDHRIDADDALRGARLSSGPGYAIYRGWMLKSRAYEALHTALKACGIEILTGPAEYEACHHTPGSYQALKAFMPETAWVTAEKLDEPEAIASALGQFGTEAVVIKDWVKSQAAGYWSEACFIPNASDTGAALTVIQRFRDLQGDSLVGGVVFKRYLPLLQTGQPADEYRAFAVNGQIVGCWPRSDAARVHGGPPADLLSKVAANVPSPFASADFGVDESGRWWLLEVGDGQVSGLPGEAVATPLFEALAQALQR